MSKNYISKSIIAPLILLLALLSMFAPFIDMNASYQVNVRNNLALTDQEMLKINISQVKQYVKYFSSLSTRVDGYPGNHKAGDFIIKVFKELGLNVVVQSYSAAIPLDNGSFIKIHTKAENVTLAAYSLWPNGVEASFTPLNGLTGKLVYVGDGNLSDFNGKDIEGNIVVMNFHSGQNWINAARFGAKAVVFLAPDEPDAYESLTKATPVPIYFPRLLAPKNESEILISYAKNETLASVYSNVSWKNITGRNIIGVLNGTDYKSDILALVAHYDSWSITPARSPAAEDSVGIASLLELARIFSVQRPKRTIWFVALSGYWEGLVGPSFWVENNLFNLSNGKDWKIWMTIELDLSSESSKLDALYGGYWNYFWSDSAARAEVYQTWVRSKIENYLKTSNIDPSTINFNFRGSYSWGTQPIPYILSIEEVSQSGSLGFALRTQFASRSHYFSPIDDFRYINWENIKSQLDTITSIITGFSNEENWDIEWTSVSPQRMKMSPGGFLSYITLIGKVVEFNLSKGWYDPVPNALVRLYTPGRSDVFMWWPFFSRYTFSDSNGSFNFYGLLPYYNWQLDAWKFNKSDGSILYAVDNGMYGTAAGISGGISNTVSPIGHPWQVLLPVFECTSVTFFDVFDPQTLSKPYILDPRSLSPFTSLTYTISVYDTLTKATPVFYGSYYSPYYDVAVVFAKKNTKVSVSFNFQTSPGLTQSRFPLIVFTNSSESNPEGDGYLLTRPITIYFSALEAANGMFYLTFNRYKSFKEHHVVSPGADLLLSTVKDHLDKANYYYSSKEYAKAYSETLIALSAVSQAYVNWVMPLYYDASTSIIFFGLMILPFSIFFESLVFHSSGKRRIILLTAIFLVCLGFLYFIHPAFVTISNSTISLLAAGLTWLAIVAILLFSGKINDLITKISEERLGLHQIGRETTSAIVHSLTTSVENMRKRKLLTSLTLTVVITVAIANTALTSTSLGLGVVQTKVSSSNVAKLIQYKAMVIKSSYGIPPNILDTPLMFMASSISNSDYIVSPRVWFYPVAYYPLGAAPPISKGDKSVTIPIVFLGISNEESQLLVSSWLIDGGTQFSSSSSVIVPSSLANSLNLTVGDQIMVSGIPFNLSVVGIFNESKASVYDLDGRSILPIDQRYSVALARISEIVFTGEQALELQPTFPSSVIIVPWQTAKKLGGFISSIAYIPKDQSISDDKLLADAKSIAISTFWTVYVGTKTESFSISKITTFLLLGYEALIPLLVISALDIISVFINNVKTRSREIYIYSSLGLSPRGVSAMFITESVVYGLIGVVLGYILGFLFNQAALTFGLVPKTFAFNFSSFFIVLSLLIVMFACVGSSLYPSIEAARVVTPSLERRWKIPTKPKGDEWLIPLPFAIDTLSEGKAILLYLKEFFTHIGYERPGYRIYSVPTLSDTGDALELTVNLTPIEYGVSQVAKITLVKVGEHYSVDLVLQRKSGDPNIWYSNNSAFIDDLRKQLLLWRSLPSEIKEKYLARGA